MKKVPRVRKWRAPADEAAKTSPGRDADMTDGEFRQIGEREPDSCILGPAASNAPTVTSIPLLVAHFTWYLLGPLILFLVRVMGIVRAGNRLGSRRWTLVFFVGVAVTVFGRWVEQRSGQGVTMSGEPLDVGRFPPLRDPASSCWRPHCGSSPT